MAFNEYLKGELEYRGMLVKELAGLTGIPKQTLDKYLLSNGSMPPADKAVVIAQALGVSVEYLVLGETAAEAAPALRRPALSLETQVIAEQVEPLGREERRLVESAVRELIALLHRPAPAGPVEFSPLQKVFLRLFR
ncbi:MAG: helix-turn-helix domain-containing protein [Treponema sp.]|nr:helix-turn-helix domain-containing protein [Treponema sp.]